jgi:hypothetical protein
MTITTILFHVVKIYKKCKNSNYFNNNAVIVLMDLVDEKILF